VPTATSSSALRRRRDRRRQRSPHRSHIRSAPGDHLGDRDSRHRHGRGNTAEPDHNCRRTRDALTDPTTKPPPHGGGFVVQNLRPMALVELTLAQIRSSARAHAYQVSVAAHRSNARASVPPHQLDGVFRLSRHGESTATVRGGRQCGEACSWDRGEEVAAGPSGPDGDLRHVRQCGDRAPEDYRGRGAAPEACDSTAWAARRSRRIAACPRGDRSISASRRTGRILSDLGRVSVLVIGTGSPSSVSRRSVTSC